MLLQCPDQKGVIAAVSQLLYGFGCNIVSSDQFTDMSCNMFFQRITFDYSDIVIGPGNAPILERAVAELANRYQIKWKLAYKNKVRGACMVLDRIMHAVACRRMCHDMAHVANMHACDAWPRHTACYRMQCGGRCCSPFAVEATANKALCSWCMRVPL